LQWLDALVGEIDVLFAQEARADHLDLFPSTLPSAPLPGMLLKFSTGSFVSEEAAMALAMGRSEFATTEAACLRSVSSSVSGERTSVSVTPKRPSVSVPVL
jgi:hypothetical protein